MADERGHFHVRRRQPGQGQAQPLDGNLAVDAGDARPGQHRAPAPGRGSDLHGHIHRRHAHRGQGYAVGQQAFEFRQQVQGVDAAAELFFDALEDEEVKKFVGEYKSLYPLLDVSKPVTYGPLDLQDYYFEHKKQQAEAMKIAKRVILEVGEEYGKLSGRSYGLFDEYQTEDAEYIIIALGSTAGTAKAAVDDMRAMGKKVGVIKLRVFRPFPAPELVQALSNAKAVAVLDRSEGFSGIGGPLFQEVRSALYRKADMPVSGYVYGLGGRDITPEMIAGVFGDLKEGRIHEDEAFHLGVRE